MSNTATEACQSLRQTSESRHQAFRAVDGDDADWASRCARRLIEDVRPAG